MLLQPVKGLEWFSNVCFYIKDFQIAMHFFGRGPIHLKIQILLFIEKYSKISQFVNNHGREQFKTPYKLWACRLAIPKQPWHKNSVKAIKQIPTPH